MYRRRITDVSGRLTLGPPRTGSSDRGVALPSHRPRVAGGHDRTQPRTGRQPPSRCFPSRGRHRDDRWRAEASERGPPTRRPPLLDRDSLLTVGVEETSRSLIHPGGRGAHTGTPGETLPTPGRLSTPGSEGSCAGCRGGDSLPASAADPHFHQGRESVPVDSPTRVASSVHIRRTSAVLVCCTASRNCFRYLRTAEHNGQ